MSTLSAGMSTLSAGMSTAVAQRNHPARAVFTGMVTGRHPSASRERPRSTASRERETLTT